MTTILELSKAEASEIIRAHVERMFKEKRLSREAIKIELCEKGFAYFRVTVDDKKQMNGGW